MESNTYLAHHGIKGQRWGVRRFQNADGSYTAAGKERYGRGDKKEIKAKEKAAKKEQKLLKKEQRLVNFARSLHKHNRETNWDIAYNKATKEFNEKLDSINNKYSKYNFSGPMDVKTYNKYLQYNDEIARTWNGIYSKKLLDEFGEEPLTRAEAKVRTGREWIASMPQMMAVQQQNFMSEMQTITDQAVRDQ